MTQVRVASVRFVSMLANRGMNVEHVADGLQADIDLDALFENDQELSFEDVASLAARFKKTWPYMLIDEPEGRVKYGVDHRTLANRAHPLSTSLLDQLSRVTALLEWAAELFPEIALTVPAQLIGTGTDSGSAAAWIRELLSVSFDDQLATRDPYAALRLWSDALQGCGVYVQMRRLNDPTVRAFSLAIGEQAAVIADTQDVPYARVFSLLHEYTHLVLRSAGICDLDDHGAVERYCNDVAAQVLMPEELMSRMLPVGARWGESIDDDEGRVSGMSGRLGVSQASVLIRLKELEVLSDASYDVLERRRRERPAKEESSGGNYHRNTINKVGRRYAKRVVSAFESGSIDRRDASTMLEIPEHNFPNLVIELAKNGE